MIESNRWRAGISLGALALAAVLLTGCVYHPHGYYDGGHHGSVDVHHQDRYDRHDRYSYENRDGHRGDRHDRRDDRRDHDRGRDRHDRNDQHGDHNRYG